MPSTNTVIALLLLTGYSTASNLLPDTSFQIRYCIGPGCPSISLPILLEEDIGHNYTDVCNGTETGLIPDPEHCQSLFECKDGNVTKLTCPIGFAFHVGFKLCVPQSLVKSCGGVYCPPTILVGTVPDLKNCTRYYKCVYSVPLHFQCDDGHIYDDELGKCSSYGEKIPSCIESGDKMNGTVNATELPQESISTSVKPELTTDLSQDSISTSVKPEQITDLPQDSNSTSVTPEPVTNLSQDSGSTSVTSEPLTNSP